MIQVDADVSDDWDSRTGWAELAAKAVRASAAASGRKLAPEAEVSVKFTSDAEVRQLNAAWRGKDKATNVLSFPMAEPAELPSAPMLGDIVLAYGVCAAETADKGVAIEDHAAHLVVHGMLHLLGYDHETNDADAEAMEGLERRALAAIGVADPYLNEVRP